MNNVWVSEVTWRHPFGVVFRTFHGLDYYSVFPITHWWFKIVYSCSPIIKKAYTRCTVARATVLIWVRPVTNTTHIDNISFLPSGSKQGSLSGRWGEQTPCGESQTQPGCCCLPMPNPSYDRHRWKWGRREGRAVMLRRWGAQREDRRKKKSTGHGGWAINVTERESRMDKKTKQKKNLTKDNHFIESIILL